MPKQQQRSKKLLKNELKEPWGLSNATLARHIPLVVKKLADSKAIIRQEAFKCLYGMQVIMRTGQ